MIIVQEVLGNIVVLIPRPGIDSSSAKQFEEVLIEGVEASGGAVIVECTELDYISSAGLRSILIAAKLSKNKGARLVLCGMKRHIRRIFDTSGFAQLLPIVTTRDEAVATVRGPSAVAVRAPA